MGTKTRIGIIEDQPLIAEDVSMMLNEMGYETVWIAHDPSTAIAQLNKKEADLVLLDINLETGQEGLDIGAYIHKNISVPFIYMTSFSDKTTVDKAKFTEPSGYIVKPVDERDIQTSVEIALHNHRMAQMNHPEAASSDDQHMYIKSGTVWERIHHETVQHLEASDNYTLIYTTDKKHVISKTLKTVMSMLPDQHYLRVHKSYVVNIDKIDSIQDGFLKIGKKDIPIGRSYKEELFSRLNLLK